MTDAPRPRVSRAALLLGYAGLLPQAAAAALASSVKAGVDPHGWGGMVAFFLALCYGSLILSFLGGVWWGFAMRRTERQGALAAAAVAPSLFPVALVPLASTVSGGVWTLVALGVAIVATLPVDRRLAATGEAPDGWMRLRAPLSLGLGGLTILTALLLA